MFSLSHSVKVFTCKLQNVLLIAMKWCVDPSSKFPWVFLNVYIHVIICNMNGPTSPHKFQTSIPSVGTVRAWLAGWLCTRAEQVAICSPELPCTSTGPGPAGSTTCKLASDWSSWPAGGGVREVSPDWWRDGVPPSNELVTRGAMINVSIGDDIHAHFCQNCAVSIPLKND